MFLFPGIEKSCDIAVGDVVFMELGDCGCMGRRKTWEMVGFLSPACPVPLQDAEVSMRPLIRQLTICSMSVAELIATRRHTALTTAALLIDCQRRRDFVFISQIELALSRMLDFSYSWLRSQR